TKAQDVVEEMKQMGVQSFKIQANVADEKEAKAMVKEVVNEFDSLDILVNNAGINRDNLLMRMKEEEFDQVIDTNLKGVFQCTKSLSRQMMRQNGGRIINVSSIVGVNGNAGQATYAAAKAGVIGLTKSDRKSVV